MVNHTLSRVLVVCVCMAVTYAGTLSWREELLINRIESSDIELGSRNALLFAEKPGRLLARKWLVTNQGTARDALYHIRKSIKNRPWYAPSWLDLAEIQIRLGNLEEAGNYIDVATKLWPNRRILLWRAAMLWAQVGRKDRIFSTLRRYVRIRPEDFIKAIVIAARFESDPSRLIEEIVPGDVPRNKHPEFYMVQMLGYGISQDKQDLAIAAWTRISDSHKKDEKILSRYLEYLIHNNNMDEVISIYKQNGSQYESGQLINGGFEDKIQNYGLGWIVGNVEGSNWSVDQKVVYDGMQSLRIDFDGSRNLAFKHLFQRIPVKPGNAYKLQGVWKGKDISTRSNPYIGITAKGATTTAWSRSESKRSSWDWQPFELDLVVPEDALFVSIRLQRDKSDALDNKLSGSVWLDNMHLAKIEN